MKTQRYYKHANTHDTAICIHRVTPKLFSTTVYADLYNRKTGQVYETRDFEIRDEDLYNWIEMKEPLELTT